jgi:hypothetical protein
MLAQVVEDPVFLPCMHSGCKTCIMDCLDRPNKGDKVRGESFYRRLFLMIEVTHAAFLSGLSQGDNA